MSLEENKAIVRRFFEAYAAGDLDLWDEICAEDLVTHQSPHPAGTRLATRKENDRAVLRAFADFSIAIEDIIAEGDKVMVRGVSTGTHRAEFAGIPPTGKHTSITMTGMYRLADGKIVEEWLNVDFMDLWRQLGVLPPWKELVERAIGNQT